MKSKNNFVKQIPPHLRRYVIKQNYSSYTPVEHALWRFILRELTAYLNKTAHPSYKTGVKKTGITLEEIPSIAHMDKCLKKLGWRAVCVSGFIPPAAFMELQAYGILPIATEMRRVDHLDYTPAPDIVHEAAGHAPMLANKEYSKYLRKYADIGSKAIITKKDFDQYLAIREMSDLKEHPNATPDKIEEANAKFERVNAEFKEPTEAVLLSRMAWWGTEYGLVGTLENSKIYGAGLLSSVGESQTCLSNQVTKIPFTVACSEYPYDITKPQPQLFVAPDFKTLSKCLDELSEKLAFKRGGLYGIRKALAAETVNTVELNSGVQVSGKLESYREDSNGHVSYLKFHGPCQVAFDRTELPGQGKKRHSHGYGTPVGLISGSQKCLSRLSTTELKKLGLVPKNKVDLEFASGVKVTGKVKSLTKVKGKLALITFTNCTVVFGNEILFSPEWGEFDMAVGSTIPSVFGGPADRVKYGNTDDFVAAKIPPKKYSESEKQLHKLYLQVRKMRQSKKVKLADIEKVANQLDNQFSNDWLIRIELYEVAKLNKFDIAGTLKLKVYKILEQWPNLKLYVDHAFELIG